MEQENLNLEEHRKILVLKALNRNASFTAAAEALGVSRRTVARDIKVYNIKKIDGRYLAVENRKGIQIEP